MIEITLKFSNQEARELECSLQCRYGSKRKLTALARHAVKREAAHQACVEADEAKAKLEKTK